MLGQVEPVATSSLRLWRDTPTYKLVSLKPTDISSGTDKFLQKLQVKCIYFFPEYKSILLQYKLYKV